MVAAIQTIAHMRSWLRHGLRRSSYLVGAIATKVEWLLHTVACKLSSGKWLGHQGTGTLWCESGVKFEACSDPPQHWRA